MRIMLVEDDYLLNKAIRSYFKSYELDYFLDGDEALDNLSNEYKIFIVDIDVPGLNGIELLKEIKNRFPTAHVIMISATIEIDMIEKAYNLGCNDYLKKPFEIKELELKIQLIEKNNSQFIDINHDLKFNFVNSTINYKDKIIELTPNETKLLSLLLSKRGQIVSTDNILYEIWNYDNANDQIRQLMGRLKKKFPYEIIKNRRGQGYIIE